MVIDKILLSQEEILKEIFNSYELQKGLLLTYLNQNCFNIYFRDESYRKLLDIKFKVYQADFGIYLLIKYLKKENVSRINATSLNENILEEIIKREIPVCFIGGNFSENFIKEECEKRNIKLIGYNSGYFNEEEKIEVLRKVNLFPAKVFFIGMGVPKQEFFAYELSKNSQDKVIICVGNFFEFYFGNIKRAPIFFRKTGIEWLFRLITEPERLWKRYILGIPEFIYRAINLKLKRWH